MTRGRRKDLTIPPSRALVQQRDYRARKAKYLADLEERVRRAEDENADLRLEVSELRRKLSQASGETSFANGEVLDASRQLLHHLNETAISLSRFRSVAFKDPSFTTPERQHTSENAPSGVAMSRSLPSPTSSHDIPTSFGPISSFFNPTEILGSRNRSASDAASIPSSHADSRRPSSSSEQSSVPITVPSYAPTSSTLAMTSGPDRPSQSRPHPRDYSTFPAPRSPHPSRKDTYLMSTYTLPPLRLQRAPEDDNRPNRTPVCRHPYPQFYDSFGSSHLTPPTWSSLPHSRSSVPSYSEDSDGNEEDSDDGGDEEFEGHRRPEPRDDSSHDYAMHDDPQVSRSGSPLHPSSPSSSYRASTSKSSSRIR